MATAIEDCLRYHRETYLPKIYNELAEKLLPPTPSDVVNLYPATDLAEIVFQRTSLPPSAFIALPLEHRVFWLEKAVQSPATDTAFQLASRVCSVFQSVFSSLAKLKNYLAKHPEIRHASPRNQRLAVHVGDLMESLAKEGQLGTDPLESPRESDALAGAMTRKQEIDSKHRR